MASKTVSVAAGVVVLAAALWWARRDAPERLERAESLVSGAASSTSTTPSAAAPRENVHAPSERTSVTTNARPRFEKLLVRGALHGVLADDVQRQSLSFLDVNDRSLRATVGPDGSYSVFGLSPGTWRVQWYASGYLPLDEELVLDGSLERVRHDVVVQPGLRLPVRFIDDTTGERIAMPAADLLWDGLGVVVTRGAPPPSWSALERSPRVSEGATYHSKRRRIEVVPLPENADGLLLLHQAPPLVAHAVLRDATLASLAITGRESELEFRIPCNAVEAAAASVVVRCVDALTGEPLAGAHVELGHLDGGAEQTLSDAKGEARFQRVAPGARTLRASSEQRYASRWVRLASGAENDVGVLELAAPVRVSGVVTGSEGELSRATVKAVPLTSDTVARAAALRNTAPVEAKGAFDFNRLAPGRWRIVASAERLAAAWVDVHVGSRAVEGLELRLVPGIPVKIHAPRGGLAPRHLLVTDSSGAPLLALTAAPTFATQCTLAPGQYVLEELAGDVVLRSRRLSVESEPLEIELEPH